VDNICENAVFDVICNYFNVLCCQLLADIMNFIDRSVQACFVYIGDRHQAPTAAICNMKTDWSIKGWLVKVVTRARVRFQIRIFFITSLLRH
jgi:hypothetical protein